MPFKRPVGQPTSNQIAPTFIRPLQDKRAIVGQKVILECQIDGHPDPVIKWLKDGQNVTQCPDYELKEEFKKHRLLIPSVQGSDCGRFTIQAMNAAGIKSSTCMLLVAPAPTPVPGSAGGSGAISMTSSPGPPQTPIGPSAPFFLKDIKHQPLRIGSLAVLEARVVGLPLPQVTWMKNGKELNNYRIKTEYDTQTGICMLTIPQMFSEDLGEYTCKASNNIGIKTSSAHIMPKEQYTKWFSDEQQQITDERKQKLMNKLQQQQQSSLIKRTTPTIQILTQQQQQQPINQQQQQQQQQKQITRNSGIPDENVLISHGEGSQIFSDSDNEEDLINSKGLLMPPLFRNELRGLRLTEGTDAVLQCSVVGIPKPKITWFKNNKLLSVSSPRILAQYSGNLAILKISMMTPEDSGEYIVLAENSIGKAYNSSRIEVYPLNNTPVNTVQRNQQQQKFVQDYQQQQQQELFLQQKQQQEEQLQKQQQEKESQQKLQQQKQEYQKQQEQQYQKQQLLEKQQKEYIEKQKFEQERQQQKLLIQKKQQYEREQQILKQKAEQQKERLENEQQLFHQQKNNQQKKQQEEQLKLQQQFTEQQLFSKQQKQLQEVEEQHIKLQQQLGESERRRKEVEEERIRIQKLQKNPNNLDYSSQFKKQQQIEVIQTQQNSPGNLEYSQKYQKQQTPQQLLYQQRQPTKITQIQQQQKQQEKLPQQLQYSKLQNNKVELYPQKTLKQISYDDKAFEQNYLPIQYYSSQQQTNLIQKNQYQQQHQPQQYPQIQKQQDQHQYFEEKTRLPQQQQQQINQYQQQQQQQKYQQKFNYQEQQQKQQLIPIYYQKTQSVQQVPVQYDFNYFYGLDANEGSNYIHPYKKLPEQVEYLLKEQQQKQQRKNNNMAAIQKQQQQQQQQRPNGVGAIAQKRTAQQDATINGVQSTQKQRLAPAVPPQTAPKGGGSASAAASGAGGNVKPPQFVEFPQSQVVKPGEKAIFRAKVSGQPTPTLSWMLGDGKPLPNDSKKYKIESLGAGQSQLTILGVNDKDLGTYACVANNSGGSFKAQFVLEFPRVGGGGVGGVGGQSKYEIPIKRQKFSASPAPQEKVTLKKVDRYKQNQNVRRGANNNLDELPEPVASKEAPKFSSKLKNLTLNEGQHALLDCKFGPVDDPNLKIAWLLNGKPIVASSRVTTLNEYGFAVLEINPVTVFDHGEYTIVAINPLGEARQTSVVEVIGQRTESVTNYLQANQENIVPIPASATQIQVDRPNFHTELRSQELFEGQTLHLETKLTPINDPKLTVEFYLNGNLIKGDDRVQTQFLSGFAVLAITNVKAQDAGYYVFRAVNDAGVAETAATVLVLPQIDTNIYETDYTTTTTLDVEDVRDLQSASANQKFAGQKSAPKFLTQLQPYHCEDELGRSYFDARIAPINDPSLRVQWLKDGQNLPNATRIQQINNFGFVSLILHPTYAEDAGVYTCLLNNSLGEAQSSAELTTVPSETLQLDPLHKQSLYEIQEIEGQEIHIGPILRDRPEETQSIEPPRFARPLEQRFEVEENQPVHFECRIQPANDVRMSVEWLHNGAPLPAAHRFRPMFDFGYVALDILYAYPEDSGTYTLIARNQLGEVQGSVELSVIGQQVLYLDAQHPEGLDRIQELEQPKNFGLAEILDRECDAAPKFLGNLLDVSLSEHDDVQFDVKLVPINDPTMTIEWFLNDQPLYNGSRFHYQNDFGLCVLNIRGVIAEDAGTYSIVARNALGEDRRNCQMSVEAHANVMDSTQHEESLGKIEYLENLNKFAKEEIEDVGPATGPQFIQPLSGDFGEIEEGEPLHLECKVEPVGDNTLKVYWLRDGHPLPHAHRFRTFHDFGFVSLDILHVYAEDSGTYTCIAENALGKAETSTQFTCEPKSKIYSDTQHPQSVQRIQQIEAPKPLPEEVPEAEKQAPFFIKELGGGQGTIQVEESDNVYLEAQTGPVDDNTVIYEWYVNDQPLLNAHRFVLSHDFGFAALNILYVYPEDSGTYTLVVRNAAGESRSSIQIECGGKDSLLQDTFHPSSVQRIVELETPRLRAEEPEPEAKGSPQFVQPLPANIDDAVETKSLHLDAQYTPVDDNTLRVEWYHNGAPLQQSNRYRMTNDFGYAALDIDFLLAHDAGEYTLVVSNEAGQAQTVSNVQVATEGVIFDDTNHPESLRRIQEIEALRPAEPDVEEPQAEPPQFTQELNGAVEQLKEGQPLHLDCAVLPINDPNLRIEWLFNGTPLQFSSRIRTIHDFGYVALEFLHIHPQDSGTYTCRAINNAGEATTQISFDCESKRNIYLDPQHEQSWVKIQEMENRQDIREPSPELVFMPPTFTKALENAEDLIEGDSIRLECRLQPVNDPTLHVEWTCNGAPLPEASRFMPARNLDLVTLDILAVYGEDSGLYSCRAISAFGDATTSATVKCQATDALLLDTQHEESWQQIQEIENRRPEEPLVEEPEKVVPHFVVDLPGSLGNFNEGDPIHLEGQIEPTNDNQLVVEWFFNGQPLSNGHRFRTTHDFGYVSLDILYAFAQDSGEYQCVARNEQGEARSQASFQVIARGTIFDDTQHPESWQRIQEIEAPKPQAEEVEPEPPTAPHFIEPLQKLERIEGQPAYFQTRVEPATDNRLHVQWFKDGAPLQNSNRHALTHDFGLVALSIGYTVANDAGTYSVVAHNDQGEDQTEGQLSVTSVEGILGDVQHQESWRRIQELEAPKEIPEAAPDAEHGAPKFVFQLISVEDLIEGQPAHFEAQYEPLADPNLKIYWLHNGRPLPASNKISMRNDFGLCSLDFHYVLPQDVGDYRCVAVNEHGEASTEAHLDCQKRPTLLLDTQHKESWRRIQELEAPRPEPELPEPTVYAKPQFTQALQSIADLPENSVAIFEARVIPVNDPSLQLQWFFNDTPLRQSNRYTMTEDFGHVVLRITGVGVHDSGVYSCKAVNQEGAAITNASMSVVGEDNINLQTAHETSWQKIQELESMDKNPHLEYPEQEFEKPVWIKTFENVEVEDEGTIIQLNGQVEPAADPQLQVEWFLNGVPLLNANRFRSDNNFGQVTLTIIHVLPHDSGVYSCRAFNAHGEATTSATVHVAGYEALLLDTQHPASWDRIQELERPKIVEEIEVIEEKEKPRFLTQLTNAEDLPEGVPIRLEATFQPARDNALQVHWEHNGAPLGASQLVRTRAELGWACLDISAVNLDHEGVYTLRITNSEGEAASSATIKVAGVGDILGDVQHEESWRQIQVLEAPPEKPPTPPPAEYPAPIFQKQIDDVECDEGEPSRFEAAFAPNNDPNVKIEWRRNDAPLAHGSKYAISQDFGYCTLAIGYTFPEDEGVYQLSVSNANGEAVTSATLKCTPKDAILGDVQHEESWRRIQEIEAPKPEEPEIEPEPKPAPKFTTPITTSGAELREGQPAHFETCVEPVNDPQMTIQWYLNGAPVSATTRIKLINDFGWVIMNINAVDVRDSGEWTCVATNAAGEAKISTTLNVEGNETLYLDPIQAQSLARIGELEAPKPERPEPEVVVFEAPIITLQLTAKPDNAEEGDSAHLEAHYTPIGDSKLRVEWLRDGQLLHHSNRHKMVSDFGFAILDILYLLANDSGEYTLRVINEAGEASTSVNIDVAKIDGLMLQTQNENKARAVQELEDSLGRRPEIVDLPVEARLPVFVEPLSAPTECESGERAHFSARYEPIDDPQLRIQWFLNNRPLLTGSRVKTIQEFGYVVLEIFPVYPEDSGEYVCKAVNSVGEAVTSTQLQCQPKDSLVMESQLPAAKGQSAQLKIHELEMPRPDKPERPDVEHGPPKFTSNLPTVPQLREGAVLHLDAQLEPLGDPKLIVEWFHDGQPVRNTARMKTIHDFGYVVLELSPAEPQDSGTWICKAKNDQGEAETQCQIEVIGDSGIAYDWVSPGERRERIDQLEDWINRPKDELAEADVEFDAPQFTEQLVDLGELGETEATAFMCVVTPVGDPTLRIEWQHNNHPIPYSNRIQMTNDFGVISLLIKHLIAQDSGEYKCIARNAKGEAVTSGSIEVRTLIEVEHPEIIQGLVDSIDAQEGESVHLECRVAPLNDPKLKVEWLRNGAPLPEANRFQERNEFGFVTLDILYAYPEDNGVYTLRVSNDKGQAETQAQVQVVARPSLEFQPQAPGSTIDNLEHHLRQFTRANLELTADDAYTASGNQPPIFKTQLLNVGVEEGDFCRFEAQIAPINDPYMKLEWFKDGKAVLIGTRFRNTLEFGFACLDLLYALPDDTGEYKCVATNKYGQASLSAKLACSGSRRVITDTQLPQNVKVKDINKQQADNLHWIESQGETQRTKQAPQFTILPRNIQANENEPARFECAVVGNPKPKVIWYVNGRQAIQGNRYRLHYDGVHYLTITHTRIADAGTIEVYAKNSEGEVHAEANLDIFQNQDFRQHKLKTATLKTSDELQQRDQQWQKETLGQLGEAFEKAPKGDVQKLSKIERAKSPLEPLESEELVQKFTRPRDDQFYDKLSYVERQKPEFPGLKLEEVPLKAGTVQRYQPETEPREEVQLRGLPDREKQLERSPPPEWSAAGGGVKLGEPVGKFRQLDEPEKELNIPARDQIRFRAAKPPVEKPPIEHVQIEEERARLAQIQQGPEIEAEKVVPHADQVQLRNKFQPKKVEPFEAGRIESDKLKDTPPVVKQEITQTTISNKPQPTKIVPSPKAAPTFKSKLQSAQAELGRSAQFLIEFSGAAPINVKWFHNGKELRSAFDTQIRTTATESRLNLNKLKTTHDGEYTVRLENVGGQCESTAQLTVQQPTSKGIPPNFSKRLTDQRASQNSTCELSCTLDGQPLPTITWFKDGKLLPNDARFVQSFDESSKIAKLTLLDSLPTDAGIYECVAKNPAGEARCKARLNIILAKTGKDTEAGPKLEAPRFTQPIKPVMAAEGASAEFRAQYTGSPEPSIRWYRNNEPIKASRNLETGYGNGEAWLKFAALNQENVAEYKFEAINPAGKASTVANLILTPEAGKVIGGKPGLFTSTIQSTNTDKKQASGAKAPQFLQKLTPINARQGQNVKLMAEIDGNPIPSVQWQFNGKPISGGAQKISLVGNKALLEIPRIQPNHAGSYVCVLRNPSGAAQCEARIDIQSR